MDDVIYEIQGYSNMELHLDRQLSERRIFPAIDLPKNLVRERKELLLDDNEYLVMFMMRREMAGNPADVAEKVLDNLEPYQVQ